MAPLTITVPGVPQGKAGARSVVRRGRLVHYTPRQTRSYETTIRVAGIQALGDKSAFEQPVEFGLRADFAVPTSWSRPKQQLAIANGIRPTTRPDLDNVRKSWLDGLSGVSFVDDALIVRMSQAQI
jgi:Holliday junction resolvase RusA-like endonuclease